MAVATAGTEQISSADELYYSAHACCKWQTERRGGGGGDGGFDMRSVMGECISPPCTTEFSSTSW